MCSSYWLGLLEKERPSVARWFFDFDVTNIAKVIVKLVFGTGVTYFGIVTYLYGEHKSSSVVPIHNGFDYHGLVSPAKGRAVGKGNTLISKFAIGMGIAVVVALLMGVVLLGMPLLCVCLGPRRLGTNLRPITALLRSIPVARSDWSLRHHLDQAPRLWLGLVIL